MMSICQMEFPLPVLSQIFPKAKGTGNMHQLMRTVDDRIS